MKVVYKGLNRYIKQIKERIEVRESNYDGRTERWQDSDKGAIYHSDTIALGEILDNLQDAAATFEEINPDYKRETDV